MPRGELPCPELEPVGQPREFRERALQGKEPAVFQTMIGLAAAVAFHHPGQLARVEPLGFELEIEQPARQAHPDRQAGRRSEIHGPERIGKGDGADPCSSASPSVRRR